MKTILAADIIKLGARDLFCFLRDRVESSEEEDLDPCEITVRDGAGRDLTCVELEREKLSDGTFAYNLILKRR